MIDHPNYKMFSLFAPSNCVNSDDKCDTFCTENLFRGQNMSIFYDFCVFLSPFILTNESRFSFCFIRGALLNVILVKDIVVTSITCIFVRFAFIRFRFLYKSIPFFTILNQ